MGFSSWLEVDVVEGTDYLIRVGAFESDAGQGVLAVSCGDVGGPDNDDCADGINLSDGATAFSLVGATTDGPNPTDVPKCDEGFDLDLVNDIWYNYTASCTGTVTVSTCDDADYDTRLAAYSGFDCPVSNDMLVGCNDDGEGCGGLTSIMTFDAEVGVEYKIRVGGFGFDCSGNLTVSCD
ncbi:MAG: hypothetical protein IH988_06055 [Planctomycetes bacterium]|nr:hypothetical protein [Planctomycetota bacterium]